MFYYLDERCYVRAEPFMGASCELPRSPIGTRTELPAFLGQQRLDADEHENGPSHNLRALAQQSPQLASK